MIRCLIVVTAILLGGLVRRINPQGVDLRIAQHIGVCRFKTVYTFGWYGLHEVPGAVVIIQGIVVLFVHVGFAIGFHHSRHGSCYICLPEFVGHLLKIDCILQ